MRITKLTLGNFKSFKEEQEVELSPVTLLFGPNSVGKSSLITALFYLQQILAKEQCNPMFIDAMGHKHIGGFENLVNGKDLNKSITIGVEYDKCGEIGESYYKLIDLLPEALGFYLDSPAVEASKVEVKFEIRWSFKLKDAYISKYIVRLDGVGVAQIESDANKMQPQIVAINYLHPLLQPQRQDEFIVSSFEDGHIHPELITEAFQLNGIELPTAREISKGADDLLSLYNENDKVSLSDECFISELHELIVRDGRLLTINGSKTLQQTIGINSRIGAAPSLGRSLKTPLELSDETQTLLIHEILSDIFISPLDNLLALLNNSLCIGPLRHIPDANYQHNPYPEQADWYKGKACWDELQKLDLIRDTEINRWLLDKDKLNLGYKLVYKTDDLASRYVSPTMEFKTVEDVLAMSDVIGESLKVSVSKESLEENPDAKESYIDSEYIEELRKSKDFHSSLYVGQEFDKWTVSTLWDCHNNIEINASDIGVGVSQLLPLIVASQSNKKGIIACEQPELHVHPRVQVAIGDLLTQSNTKGSFLIETHSEHLILRLLRRVRETSESKLPVGQTPVLPNDISVIFLSKSEEGVIVKKLDITSDGDFEKDWPGGFFDERDEELF